MTEKEDHLITCPKCGRKIPENLVHCWDCGQKVNESPDESRKRRNPTFLDREQKTPKRRKEK